MGFSLVTEREFSSLVVVWGLLTVVASLIAEHEQEVHWLSNCRSQALRHWLSGCDAWA